MNEESQKSASRRCGRLATLLACFAAWSPALAFNVYKVDPTCPEPGVFATIHDAVAAAAANPGEDYVWISHDGHTTTYHEHVVINDADGVIIEGGFNDCYDFDPGSDTTTVSGDGNGGFAVFEISGTSHVYLGNLGITGANHTASTRNGGGISFVGQGELTLANVAITNNQADVGGGVYMEYSNRGAMGDLTLTLLDNAQIAFNTAINGGGIAMIGSAPGFTSDRAALHADAPGVWIAYNDATGSGGGLLLKWLGSAQIGSPGLGTLGVIYNNSAANGGGIAMINPANYDASDGPYAHLYTTDPAHPVRIRNNTATQFGGAIYTEASRGMHVANDASLLASDFRIDENIAAEGSAIYAEPNGGDVDLTLGPQISKANCDAGVLCNSIDHNVDEDSAGPTGGAAITFTESGFVEMNRISLRNNVGGNVVHAISSGIQGSLNVAISNALIADNTTSSDLLKFAGPGYAPIQLLNVTIAHNSVVSPNVVYAEHNVTIDASIIDQAENTAIGYAGPADGLIVTYSIASAPGAAGEGFVVGAPNFVDAAGGDYHLLPWSPGLDFAPTPPIGAPPYDYDLDGKDRVKDLSSIPNVNTGARPYRDAGAYELQFVCAPDEVFCSGFEH
jgi:predicted outer membrane repeat protein